MYWTIVIAITAACLIVVSDFSANYRVMEGIVIFSIIPSIPLYLYRRRNEKMIADYLEKHDDSSEKSN